MPRPMRRKKLSDKKPKTVVVFGYPYSLKGFSLDPKIYPMDGIIPKVAIVPTIPKTQTDKPKAKVMLLYAVVIGEIEVNLDDLEYLELGDVKLSLPNDDSSK